MENPIKIHDLGVPLFLETPIYFQDEITPWTLKKDLREGWNWVFECHGSFSQSPEISY